MKKRSSASSRFEAQQNVPFPIDEVVWDYQLVGGGTEEQIQVVLVAIKADLLEGINAAVESAGLRTDAGRCRDDGALQRVSLQLQRSDGLFAPGRYRRAHDQSAFHRTGKIFSAAAFRLAAARFPRRSRRNSSEPLAAAEFRKKRDGFVSLGGAYAEPADPDIARMSKIVRSTMTRLHAELMRSISHYRAQQQGNAPRARFSVRRQREHAVHARVFSGETAVADRVLQSAAQCRRRERVDRRSKSRSRRICSANWSGLRLRSTTTCPMELNLAAGQRRARAGTGRNAGRFSISAAACFVLGLLGWSAYYLRAASGRAARHGAFAGKVDAMRAVETQMSNLRKRNQRAR